MKKVFVIFLLLQRSLHGQINTPRFIDSMTYDFKQKSEWWFSFDFKNTFISNLPVKMFGMQAGKQYNKRSSWYIGYYNAPNVSRILENPTAAVNTIDTNTVFQKYSLGYFNFGLEYQFKDTRRWRFYIPLSMGIGKSNEQILTQKKLFRERSNLALPLESGIYGSYKLLWWLWISGGIGARIDLNPNSGYNGSFYTLGLNIRYVDMYNRVRKKIKERNG